MNKQSRHFSVDQIAKLIETWLITGELNSEILAQNFKFTSPFWKSNDRAAFIAKFQDPTEYQKTSLSNIIQFDPIIRLKNLEDNHFAIILQYHTKNGHSVWETVLGNVQDGKLIELRSIYDLAETQKAHGLK